MDFGETVWLNYTGPRPAECLRQGEVVNVRIMVRGPEDRRVEHVADIAAQDELHHAIGVALGMYENFYQDAPPFRKTVEIDPAWKAPHFSEIEEFS